MKILFANPYESSLFSFRKELLDALIVDGHDIILCVEKTQKVIKEYESKVLNIVDIKMNLKDRSIFKNLFIKKKYKKTIRKERPDVILSFGIKPNIYCGLYSKNIPTIANITGLGNIETNNKILNYLIIHLYRKSFKNVDCVFFQNEDEYEFFKKHKIPVNSYKIIPGSGVNTEKYFPINNELEKKKRYFLYASRAIKEKGFNLLVDAVPKVVETQKNAHFIFLSAEEDVLADQTAKIIFAKYKDYVTILPRIDDMNKLYNKIHFLVSPSFYKEGISNVLLESLSCGRPIITTMDNSGCKETLIENVNGYGIISNDLNSLVNALVRACNTPVDQIISMGKNGREFVMKKFQRQFVIDAYFDTLNYLVQLTKKI